MNRMQTYSSRQKNYEEEARRLGKQQGRWSLFRLFYFLAVAALTAYLFTLAWYWGTASLLLCGYLFFRIIRYDQRLQGRKEQAESLAALNQREQQSMQHEFPEAERGDLYRNAEHPYSGDLDLFGAYSLFHYLNRAQTETGRDRLAAWLTEPAPPQEVVQRQAAIGEWKDRLDWRQEWQVKTAAIREDRKIRQALEQWLTEAPLVLPNRWLRLCLWLVPLGWIGCGLAIAYGLPWGILAFYLLFPAVLLGRRNEAINGIHRHTGRTSAMLEALGGVLPMVEQLDPAAPRLKALRSQLTQGTRPLSAALEQLSYYAAQLDVRYNVFALLLNLLGLWDIFWVWRLEQWKERERERLPEAFEVLAEVEALQTLATAWYNHPDWTLPQIGEQASLHAVGIGHPLIPAGDRVLNDLEIPIGGHLWLITGSNMAGKSTFLRTVGVNLVLARCGSAVCAASLTLPPLRVFTSMRTQDALHESTSSFFAELKRLRQLIELVDGSEEPVFFLLDEVLKGTNSRDRHRGGEALIRQLIQTRASGLLATHDIELGRLEAEYPDRIQNWRLEVEIEGEELTFDYKLKRGVTESFNASILMKQMGIRV